MKGVDSCENVELIMLSIIEEVTKKKKIWLLTCEEAFMNDNKK